MEIEQYNDPQQLKRFSGSFGNQFIAPQIRYWLQYIFKKPEHMTREEQEYYDSMEKFAQKLRQNFKGSQQDGQGLFGNEIIVSASDVEVVKGILGDNYRYLTARIEEKERLGGTFMDASKEVEMKEQMDVYFGNKISNMADSKEKSFYKPYPNKASKAKVKIGEPIDPEFLAKQEESDVLEFKSSLRWNTFSKQSDKTLEYEAMVAVCAFANTSGGRLVIGIDNSGLILGIENDYKTFKNKNADGFRLKFVELTDTYLGKAVHQLIDIKIETIEGKDVCILTVEPSDQPIYLKHDGVEEFFVRVASVSQKLGMADAHSYISKRF